VILLSFSASRPCTNCSFCMQNTVVAIIDQQLLLAGSLMFAYGRPHADDFGPFLTSTACFNVDTSFTKDGFLSPSHPYGHICQILLVNCVTINGSTYIQLSGCPASLIHISGGLQLLFCRAKNLECCRLSSRRLPDTAPPAEEKYYRFSAERNSH